MHFVANLRNETIEAFQDEGTQPAFYLLSSHRVSRSSLKAAHKIRQMGVPLFADNGTKPLIEEILTEYGPAAAAIRDEVARLRKRNGSSMRPPKIPTALRKIASDLAHAIVARATLLSDAVDGHTLLQTQLSMGPTDLIAKEDFATACLIGLGLEREITGWQIERYNTRIRRSLRLWESFNSDPQVAGIRTFAVLSAPDYNCARSAGRIAASAGVRHVALGVAGIMSDSGAVDRYVRGRAAATLPRPVPRRSIRLALVVKGLADGFRDRGAVLTHFHCLGLGAAPMLPLVAAALPEKTIVTSDATSPIHDAVRDQVLYQAESNGARMTTRQIVKLILDGRRWEFSSPFVKRFRTEFGHDPVSARQAWIEKGRPEITRAVLKSAGRLTECLPLFAEAIPATKKAALRAQIAHNHWVLDKLCQEMPDGDGRHELANAVIDAWLAGPATVTSRGLEAARAALSDR